MPTGCSGQAVAPGQAGPAVRAAEEFVRQAQHDVGVVGQVADAGDVQALGLVGAASPARSRWKSPAARARPRPCCASSLSICLARGRRAVAQDLGVDGAQVLGVDVDGAGLQRGQHDGRVAQALAMFGRAGRGRGLAQDLAEDVRLGEALGADDQRAARCWRTRADAGASASGARHGVDRVGGARASGAAKPAGTRRERASDVARRRTQAHAQACASRLAGRVIVHGELQRRAIVARPWPESARCGKMQHSLTRCRGDAARAVSPDSLEPAVRLVAAQRRRRRAGRPRAARALPRGAGPRRGRRQRQRVLLSKPTAKGDDLERVTARPLVLRGERCLSFVFKHRTKDITKNEPVAAALETIAEPRGRAFRARAPVHARRRAAADDEPQGPLHAAPRAS